MWLLLTLFLLLALVAVHFGWRWRYVRDRSALYEEMMRQQANRHAAAVQTEVRQEAVFDSMAAGLLLLDRKGRIQFANRALVALAGGPANLRGKTLLEVLRRHELAELAERAQKENRSCGLELQLSGMEERWFQVSATTLPDADGSSGGLVLVFHDTSRLKQVERARVDFVANVSHELRTPLTIIQGFTETLLDGAKDDPALAVRFLEKIERHSRRLSLLITDLLTLSQLDAGAIHLNRQPVALRSTVDKVFEDLAPRAASRATTLVNDVPSELTVNADPERLQQVLGNLLDNGIKYGRTGGTVVTRGHRGEAGKVFVCVADDGPGLPPEAMSRVFERFYRVDKGRSREQGGTGLGLAIVKHLVAAHGGRVWVESHPGQGAAFHFTLPPPD